MLRVVQDTLSDADAARVAIVLALCLNTVIDADGACNHCFSFLLKHVE
jgi:ABC-type transport system involved in Fe-S cluster assembly fused permease/ATPase subunit